MIEPLGYLDIILKSLELFSLIGLLVLFFMQHKGYRRASIGRDSWPTILVYNILTLGAYGIYWRLKVTYALHSRDRLSGWQWLLLLLFVFVVYVTDIRVLTILTIWDFILGSRLQKTTGEQFSWLWTFVCGHLYLASYVEREADRLPLDFRVERPDRRPGIVTLYCAAVLVAVGVIGVSLWALARHRAQEFAKIPNEALDHSGYWHEVHEKYEKIYAEDEKGRRDVYVMINSPEFNNVREWARFTLDTKFYKGGFYTYNWFSCVDRYEVVESRPDLLVTRNDNAQSIVENRIQAEKFAVNREDFLKNATVARGWELGQLLRSPWSCELSFILHAWNQAIDFSRDLVMRRIFPD
ncbi:MAG TPA: hypothetical protein VFO10_15650 [Oligoflexus sp.]|uniref:hypothetical protein n=1 Tax=Oligoflexus sp. TaxID=1971216 RepID=UPI002D7FF689|nr:hypothetical protein [Oligoflexus sp.]HET9238696.1 hypothetical protein [Oligoflexus sp.]